jgi:phosphatidylglycerophosphate synthase
MISIKQLRELSQSEKISKRLSTGNDVGLIWVGYTIHRRVSIYITYFLIRFFPKCTANSVSASMLLVTLLGAGLVMVQNVTVQLAGLFLCYFAFLLDKVDGELARYRDERSVRGCYLDEWYHVLAPTSLLLGVFLIPAYTHSLAMTVLLILAVTLSVVRRFERKWYLMVAGKQKNILQSQNSEKQRKLSVLHWILNNPLFKMAGVIDRYDLWLLSFSVMLLVSEFVSSFSVLHVLLAYTTLSLIYTVRLALLNYFGRFEFLMRSFIRDGF